MSEQIQKELDQRFNDKYIPDLNRFDATYPYSSQKYINKEITRLVLSEIESREKIEKLEAKLEKIEKYLDANIRYVGWVEEKRGFNR